MYIPNDKLMYLQYMRNILFSFSNKIPVYNNYLHIKMTMTLILLWTVKKRECSPSDSDGVVTSKAYVVSFSYWTTPDWLAASCQDAAGLPSGHTRTECDPKLFFHKNMDYTRLSVMTHAASTSPWSVSGRGPCPKRGRISWGFCVGVRASAWAVLVHPQCCKSTNLFTSPCSASGDATTRVTRMRLSPNLPSGLYSSGDKLLSQVRAPAWSSPAARFILIAWLSTLRKPVNVAFYNMLCWSKAWPRLKASNEQTLADHVNSPYIQLAVFLNRKYEAGSGHFLLQCCCI